MALIIFGASCALLIMAFVAMTVWLLASMQSIDFWQEPKPTAEPQSKVSEAGTAKTPVSQVESASTGSPSSSKPKPLWKRSDRGFAYIQHQHIILPVDFETLLDNDIQPEQVLPFLHSTINHK